MSYKTPASEWIEGLPIGNGRLAAMVWGDRKSDILTLNHEWLWRGVQRNRKVYEGAKYLNEIRDLLKNKEYFKATSMANTFLGGEGGMSGIKGRVDAYQVAGELIFRIDNVDDYIQRELDISTGMASTVRNAGNTKITSEFFADCVSELLMSSWTADKDFSGNLVFQRVEDNDAEYKYIVKNNRLEFQCVFKGGIEYRVFIDVFTDGKMKALVNGFRIEHASFIKAITNIASSVKDIESELKKYQIQLAETDEAAESEIIKSLNAYKGKHMDKFSKLMNRIEFSLKEDCSSNNAEITTDQRIQNVKDGQLDNGIYKLYFDYGRYLLLSSSICGELPANLQGKWNDRIDPPWDCDYHFNINLQMNYWMAEPCNMIESAEKLISYVKSFMKSGREAALKLYGCRGIYLPLQTDAWGVSTPEAYGWAVWIGAAPWIAQHLWWHYIYSGDKEYLRNTAYEFFAEVAAFYEDYLIEDDEGLLQIMPSQSPENRFHGTGHFPVSIGVSAAMDVQLAYDALNYAIQSAEMLKIDEEKVIKWKQMQSKLPAFKVGSDGRLLEWNEEMDEIEPGHRHLSHLYGLYPSDLFTLEKRPAQYNASIKSLESRLSHGGGHTGWSRAWVSCLFARIGDSNRFFEHFSALIKDFATISLLDLHPPGIFQIDGNFGAVSAVIEAIIGYYDGKAHLLGALPEQWQDGYLRGVKLPGGHIVDMEWENKRIRALSVEIGFEEKVLFRYEDEEIAVEGNMGEVINVF